MTRRVYLAVEGPHDVEFVGRLLRLDAGLERRRLKSEVDDYWVQARLIPEKYPFDKAGEDLLVRSPVPAFFEDETVSVAVHSAGGDTGLGRAVEETLATLRLLDLPLPDAIGVVLDADVTQTPVERFDTLAAKVRELGLSVPGLPGKTAPGPPTTGVFVLPDNRAQGTLEDILLECARKNYPDMAREAEALVASFSADRHLYSKDDLRDILKPAGRTKASVACVGSVLRPGKAIQVSIQDSRWVDPATRPLPRVKALAEFLSDLLGRAPPSSAVHSDIP